ncbi:MAG: hypothetical protein D6732_10590 [Methanobacteriota archaeon]|nr:MAG: hypothetical protein D6732_10590 [Euryarchaeota archaeon]
MRLQKYRILMQKKNFFFFVNIETSSTPFILEFESPEGYYLYTSCKKLDSLQTWQKQQFPASKLEIAHRNLSKNDLKTHSKCHISAKHTNLKFKKTK